MPPFIENIMQAAKDLASNAVQLLKKGIAAVVEWATTEDPVDRPKGNIYQTGDLWIVTLADGGSWHSKRKRDLLRRARERGIDLVELVETGPELARS